MNSSLPKRHRLRNFKENREIKAGYKYAEPVSKIDQQPLRARGAHKGCFLTDFFVILRNIDFRQTHRGDAHKTNGNEQSVGVGGLACRRPAKFVTQIYSVQILRTDMDVRPYACIKCTCAM